MQPRPTDSAASCAPGRLPQPRQPAQLTNDADERGSQPWGSSPLAARTRPARPASATPRPPRRSATASFKRRRQRAPRPGGDRRDGNDALDSHRILNREPKLRRGGHRVGPGASGIANPSFDGGEDDLLGQDRPRALPGAVLGPTSDSWHDRGWFRHRLGRGNAVGRPVVPQLLIGVRPLSAACPTAPKQCALGADR